MLIRSLFASLSLTLLALPALAESPRVTAEEQAVAARYQQLTDQGNSEAAWQLGHMSIGAPKDPGAYQQNMRKAAEAGHPFAEFELGMSLQKTDPTEGLNWLLKSARTGNEMAQISAATALLGGQGAEKNPILAYGWYKVAADSHPDPADGLAGMARRQIEGMAKRFNADEAKSADYAAASVKESIANPAEARIKTEEAAIFEQMRDLAQQDNSVAQYRLAGFYSSGHGTTADPATAVTWYAKSAANGLPAAELSLGSAYASGRGVAQDEALALAHYRKAADAGNADAQFQTGDAYRNGKGVAQNNAEAYFWVSLAVETLADNPGKAKMYRSLSDSLAKTLSRDALAEQDVRRKAWKPVEAY